MSRSNKPPITLESISFVSPEQRLLRFLMSEPTTSFTPRVLSSKLKGVRGLGGIEGITEILKQLQDLELVIFLNNNREICLQNEHPAVQVMKAYTAVCDLDGLRALLPPIASKGILFGSRATGKYRSDSNYNILIVSDVADEALKIVKGHPFAKKIEPMIMNADEFAHLETKKPELARKVNAGVVLWGSSW